MRAVIIEQHGGPEVVKVAEIATPEPGRGQVRVRVRASALNHLDLWVRRGLPGLPPSFPHISGCDVAGEVEQLGEGVTNWQVGERVLVNPTVSCGTCEWCLRGDDNLCDSFAIIGEHMWGGLAEYAVVPAINLARIPDHLSFEEAAAIPLVYATAWRMLITQAAVKPGETVLILGAGGGVNSAAIQIAKAAGARVWATTSSEEKMARARELGAEWVVNYRTENWSKAVWQRSGKRGVDVIVDNVGEATWSSSLRSLAKAGRLVTVGATTGPKGDSDIRYIFWRQLKIMGSTMCNRGEFLDVMRLIEQGVLRPVVDRVLPMEETVEGHRLLEQGEQFGKIVIRIP
jgi:NADPH:quinone reductase-like Zn-dependent oxidoreductase